VSCFSGSFITAARVVAVVANTSITIQGNIGGVSPTSSGALTVYPISIGDAGASGSGPDGWGKTSTLTTTPDDFAANAAPGALRTLLVRKGSSSVEQLTWTVSANQIQKYLGRPITCGVMIKGATTGSGSFFINDNIAGLTSGNTVTGAYAISTVQATINSGATSVSFGYQQSGTSGDPSWIGLPTCAFGTSPLVQSQLHQNSNEHIRADNHFNPPLLTPWTIQFTPVLASGLYGYNSIDIEAISLGAVHKSVGAVWAKVEWTTTSVGSYVLTANNVNASQLTFGPQQYTTVASVTSAGGPSPIPIYYDGTFSVFTNSGSLSPTSLTFDFWDVDVSNGNSLN
jgi:hypothetical protein